MKPAAWSLILLFSSTLTGTALAEELTGRDIMVKVRDNTRSQDSTSTMTMRIQSGKKERVREVEMFAKSYGDVDKSLMRFLSPSDVKGTGFLIWGQEDRDDDQWLFLPALRRVKKIASNKRDGSFMGSDFSYYDMEDRSVDEGEHKLLRTEPCGDKECYVLESTDKSRKDPVYSKSIVWIEKDRFLTLKMELYDKKGEHFKTASFENYEQVKNRWVAKKVIMKNVQEDTQTVLEIGDVKLDEGLGDEYFTQRYLMRAL